MNVPTPSGLQDGGSALWESVAGMYELRPDEIRMLEAACHAQDRVDAMELERNGAVTATGSMGQLVVHPLVAEIRAHEAQIASLLVKLKLPDEPGGEKPNQQREAANSRWAVPHGASA